MSRTKHHRNQRHQHCGEDFWSKRAGMGYYSYCRYGKFLTIRKERAAKNRDILYDLKISED
ncbi:MAG: hypothetical protein PHC28_10275 [Flavobacterium sp.]|uniref:hypothetical protein n=1 Tax=Flavobacterium sp. TaxID=239 RepID=UPI002638C5FA|nr:hypothetical protein [Flavobacterium sp.]MDD5150843.1 hypothetical protein [Flavobacterium sp.]